ncbi:CocE/NonD family hydrolase [Zavarzinia sp.]|uniref:CocE/NonD family hydrolase n=1 Tax=Zavarzinia sp. TaxID=2027920 RepID=UPI0035617912
MAIEQAPAAFRQITIPLSDGTPLAARLWLPEDGAGPFPVVMEWIPYRQSDMTAVGDSMMHGWFARHGIACVRVDIRGSGNSGGLLGDEYLRQEQDDAVEVIAWLASRDWCSGSVGMIGISWGGFAALQVAARRPPALKAIITCCSTDDRYADDVHYMGGCLLSDGIAWGHGLFGQLARPPDPRHVGDKWREMWHRRLEGLEPPLASWLAHPRRDDFWRHASVCEDYGAIACAVYAVGGWTDGYSDAVLRLMEHLSVPRKALIGPWTHVYPTWGAPGPAVDFLQEALRWWKHWLKGEDTGMMAEPTIRLWHGEGLKPDAHMPAIGGDWRGLPAWPPAPGTDASLFHLDEGRLASAPPVAPPSIPVDTPMTAGMAGGEWCPLDGGSSGPEFQTDQRPDDGLSVCFDTLRLGAPVDLVGKAFLDCSVALAGSVATLALRLCDVAPDGTSARVTFGLHRVERPAGVPIGVPFRLRLALKGVAYRFGAGHRIRLAVSNAYWPMAWPEPTQLGVVLHLAGASLSLPGLPAEMVKLPAMAPPQWAPALPHEILRPEETRRITTIDAASGRTTLTIETKRQATEVDGLTFHSDGLDIFSILPGDPASAQATITREMHMRRPGWAIRLETRSDVGVEAGRLVLDCRIAAFENDGLAFSRHWRRVLRG